MANIKQYISLENLNFINAQGNSAHFFLVKLNLAMNLELNSLILSERVASYNYYIEFQF